MVSIYIYMLTNEVVMFMCILAICVDISFSPSFFLKGLFKSFAQFSIGLSFSS